MVRNAIYGIEADWSLNVIDAGVFILLLASWTLGYVALCPPSETHRHVDFAAVLR